MKKLLFIIFLSLGLLMMLSLYFKPSIVVYNNSRNIVYLYKSTGIKNTEPDIEQAEEAMRPTIIKTGDYEKIILSWRDLKLVNGKVYLGWKAMNHTQSISRRSSGIVFDISSDLGECTYEIHIENEQDIARPLERVFCFGGISTPVNRNK